MSSFRGAMVVLALSLCSAAVATAQNLVVTVTNGGTPVKGAFVSIVGTDPSRAYGGITGSAGTHTFASLTADTYTVTASAPGTTVGTATAASGATTAAVTVTSSGTVFSGLGAYGSQTGAVMADGRSGIFYLSTTAIPSLYRTYDYGGTWAPVTLASDDSTNGLPATQSVSTLTTSGSPGEVAAIVGSSVYYSRDFGVTWKSMALPFGVPGNGVQLLWGHSPTSAAQSQLFVVNLTTTAMHAADMSVATPSLAAVSSSYKAAAGDRLAIANGNGQSFLAVAAAAGGDVRIYRVSATPSSADPNTTVTGAAPTGAPTFVRLGGDLTGGPMIPSSAGTIAPNVVLVYTIDANAGTAGNQPAARMSSYVSGTWRTTSTEEFRQRGSDGVDGAGAWENGPNSCGAQAGAVGSVAPKRLPSTSPTSSYGTVAMCWIEQSSTDYTKLIVRPVSGINNNTGAVYDASWGGTAGGLVMLSADGGKGMVKSDRWSTSLNRPDFPQWPTLASGGFTTPPYATTTGGVSINGVNAAVIKDTVFQPGSSQNMVVTMSFSGGGRVVGTRDGGVTWNTMETRGAGAVDWWTGATSGQEWILTGSSGDGLLLAATRLSASIPYSAGTTLTQLAGTSTLNLTQPGGSVTAIAGMPGTNKAAVAAVVGGSGGGLTVTESVITYVTLTAVSSGSPAALTSVTATLSPSLITIPANGNSGPVAMAYCPTSGSHAAVADRLFIAVSARESQATDGYVLSVTGASTSSPSTATQFATGYDFTDVRIDCATGTLYAGARVSGGGSGVFRATVSGGALGTLGPVSVPDLGTPGARGRIETLDIAPSDVNRVVAVTRSGDVFQTVDGGVNWTLLNSASTLGCNATLTSCGRGFGAETPGDIEIAPAAAGTDVRWGADAARATTTARAVFGSGSGLYSTRLSSDGGSGGGSGSTGGPTVTVNANQSLTIRWTAVSGASTYLLYLYQGGTQLSGSPFNVGPQTEITTGPSPLPNGTYAVAVAGVVGGVTGTQSSQSSFTIGSGGGGGTAPGAPGTPTVTVSGGAVTIAWTAASGNPTSYQLAVTQGGTPIQGSPFNVGNTTAVGPVSGLPAGTYAVTVTALNGTTPGTASAAAPFTISGSGGGGGAAPGTPGTPTVTVTGGAVTIAWTAASGGPTSYQLAVTQGGTPIQGSPFNVGPSTSVGPVSGLPAGTYAVTVTALNGSTPGTASAAATFTISGSGGGGGAAPGTPGTPTVTVTGGAVTIAWAAASGSPTSYQLAVTQGGTPLQGSPFNVGPSTSVGPVSGLPAGTYAVTVTALNGSTPGTSSASATFTISGSGGGAAPGTPGKPSVTVAGGAVSVSWAAASGTVTAYRIAVTQSGVALPGSPFNVGNTTAVGPVSGLPPGTYVLTVTALNDTTPGTASEATTFTIP